MHCGLVLGCLGPFESYLIVSIWLFQSFGVFSGSLRVALIELDSLEATRVV